MLTLITGLPGQGKTLYALQYVEALAKREGRTVWFHGINGLSTHLGWHKIPTKTESLNGKQVSDPNSDNVEVPQWWTAPKRSIVLIDECQNCGFGVRSRAVTPKWARLLETHRHLGIDLVFITQDPGLLDAHDRKLCELHFHVMRVFGLQRATVHEFRPARDSVKTRKGSIEHSWKFPKHVYKWYTSAEAHTHRARIPAKLWLLAGIIVALPILSLWLWVNYLDPQRVRSGVARAGAPVFGAAPTETAYAGGRGRDDRLSPPEWAQHQQPRVEGLAYSAPVYDDVTKPVHAPYPAACVQMGKRCECYTQQATKLEMPDTLCRGIVKGGFFVAWGLQAGTVSASAPVAPNGPVEARSGPVMASLGSGYGLAAAGGLKLPAPAAVPASGPSR